MGWDRDVCICFSDSVTLRCDADHPALSTAVVKKERGFNSSTPKLLSWRVAGQLYFECYPKEEELNNASDMKKSITPCC
jgi:hypothetical protein